MNKKMPVLFVGHGSPMNAIENNEYTQGWAEIAAKIPTPKTILSISAHWYTEDTKINDSNNPETIYDMYGFPDELYKVVYDAPGALELAHPVQNLITRATTIDNTWGIDHGTWSVLHHIYPAYQYPCFSA